MCFNEGKIDRILRGAAGVAVIAWGLYAQNYWGAVGLVPLVTAIVGFCPFYAIFKINTGCDTNK